MKKCLLYIFVFFFWAVSSNAQTIISGVVFGASNTPIPYASVYLSKTTVGVVANIEGIYSLTIPHDGNYELISSCVGYKSFSKIIKVEGENQKINIKLNEELTVLSEVVVKEKDRNRQQNYNQFLKYFIGNTPNAPFCTIQNSKDLIVYHESKDSILIAYSIKPLIITNSSLGYQIIYDLKNFSYNFNTGHLRFSGDYYFRDISNHKMKNSRENRDRLIAYYGSRMHFLRALFTESVSRENFEMCNVELDSCGTEILTNLIKENDLRLALTHENMTLDFPNHILINYYENHPELFRLPQIYRPVKNTSIIAFSDSIQVFKNGYYPDRYGISWGGHMAGDRIAEMLPYDFVPILPE